MRAGQSEGRMPKNWCLWTVVLEKTSESPFDSKEIKPVNLKGHQSWIFIGRTDPEAEAPVFGSSDVNRWLIGKVPDTGKDWGQKKRASEDEMAGWHHRCNETELGQTLGDSEGQGGLVCCSPWGHKVGHDWAAEQQHSQWTIECKLHKYNTVIHNFWRFYSIYSYYNTLAIFPVLYNIPCMLFILYIK